MGCITELEISGINILRRKYMEPRTVTNIVHHDISIELKEMSLFVGVMQ